MNPLTSDVVSYVSLLDSSDSGAILDSPALKQEGNQAQELRDYRASAIALTAISELVDLWVHLAVNSVVTNGNAWWIHTNFGDDIRSWFYVEMLVRSSRLVELEGRPEYRRRLNGLANSMCKTKFRSHYFQKIGRCGVTLDAAENQVSYESWERAGGLYNAADDAFTENLAASLDPAIRLSQGPFSEGQPGYEESADCAETRHYRSDLALKVETIRPLLTKKSYQLLRMVVVDQFSSGGAAMALNAAPELIWGRRRRLREALRTVLKDSAKAGSIKKALKKLGL